MHDRLLSVCRSLPGASVLDIECVDPLWGDQPQGQQTVHGFHKLYYWLRSRGKGCAIVWRQARVVCCYRSDIEKIVLIRPVGNLCDIVDMINRLAAALRSSFDQEIWCRYIASDLYREMSLSGWSVPKTRWSQNAIYDDENWPEVKVARYLNDGLQGGCYRLLRKARAALEDRLVYRTNDVCEEDVEPFCRTHLPLASSRLRDKRELLEYVKACFTCGEMYTAGSLSHHYLSDGSGRLVAYGVAAHSGVKADAYVATVEHRSHLMTYLIHRICCQMFKSGAVEVNLGGSEVKSLHTYKANTFGCVSMQETKPLCLV